MMDRRQKEKFDARSPVQPGRSSAPYLVAAIVAAIVIWTLQQHFFEDSGLPTTHSTSSERARRQSGMPATSRGDVRTIFSSDDYPASAQAKGEEGTVQAKLDVDAEGRVSRCLIIRSSGHRSLDNATCSIIRKRARFAPARDAEGNAIASTFVTPPVRWQLEG